MMALSYGATFISASAIVGFGGVAAAFGMGIQWLGFLHIFFISYRLHILRFAYPAHGSKTECQHFSTVIRPSFSFP